jgi:hypothetical protein
VCVCVCVWCVCVCAVMGTCVCVVMGTCVCVVVGTCVCVCVCVCACTPDMIAMHLDTGPPHSFLYGTTTHKHTTPHLSITAGENPPQQCQGSPLYFYYAKFLLQWMMGWIRVINLYDHSLYRPDSYNTYFTTLSSCCVNSTMWTKNRPGV